MGRPIDGIPKAGGVFDDEMVSIAGCYRSRSAKKRDNRKLDLLAWHDFVASILAIRIDGVLVDDRIHDSVIGIPVQFPVIFRGEERPVKFHLTDRLAVGPRISNCLDQPIAREAEKEVEERN